MKMKLTVGVLVSHRVRDLELSDLSLPMFISRKSPGSWMAVTQLTQNTSACPNILYTSYKKQIQ